MELPANLEKAAPIPAVKITSETSTQTGNSESHDLSGSKVQKPSGIPVPSAKRPNGKGVLPERQNMLERQYLNVPGNRPNKISEFSLPGSISPRRYHQS